MLQIYFTFTGAELVEAADEAVIVSTWPFYIFNAERKQDEIVLDIWICTYIQGKFQQTQQTRDLNERLAAESYVLRDSDLLCLGCSWRRRRWKIM